MTSQRLFFILIGLLALVYLVGLSGNWLARSEGEDPGANTEKQKAAARELLQGGWIRSMESVLDPFAPRLDLLDLALRRGCRTAAGTIVLDPGHRTCNLNIPPSDKPLRKARLAYDSSRQQPAPVRTEERGFRPDLNVRPELMLRKPPHLPATVGRVRIDYQPSGKQMNSEFLAGDRPLSLSVQEGGGRLSLACDPCNGKFSIRVE